MMLLVENMPTILDVINSGMISAGEDRPKRHKKHHYVKVLVFEVATDIQIREHKIDFSDPRKRKWLSGLVVWATSNQKSVEIEAI